MSGSSKIICEDNIWVPKPPVCQKSKNNFTDDIFDLIMSVISQIHHSQFFHCCMFTWIMLFAFGKINVIAKRTVFPNLII